MSFKKLLKETIDSLVYSRKTSIENWKIYKEKKGKINLFHLHGGLEVIFDENFQIIASYNKDKSQMGLICSEEASDANLFYKEPELFRNSPTRTQ